MAKNNTYEKYFWWLLDCIEAEDGYLRLLRYMHNVRFYVSDLVPMDQNRVLDAYDLRNVYLEEIGSDQRQVFTGRWVSVLEVMVALAYRCEKDIMRDFRYGNRTAKWFWCMIDNLGLGDMDIVYDEDYIREALDLMMRREYKPNGEGGLFPIYGCREDLRTVEIWYQMNWWLVKYYLN